MYEDKDWKGMRRRSIKPTEPKESCPRICTAGMIFAFIFMCLILVGIGVIPSPFFLWIIAISGIAGLCLIWAAGSFLKGRSWMEVIAYMISMIILIVIFMYIVGYANVIFPS